LNPSVFFTTPGEYVLELDAETGQQRLYDQIKIVVKSGVRIGTSTYGSYFIDENNTVWAAGGNLYGQLGNGTAGIDGTDQTGYGVPYMDVDWWRVHYCIPLYPLKISFLQLPEACSRFRGRF
jgi:hypothetical protein